MWDTKLTAIDSSKGKWKLIFFTGIISFIFINVFEPFGLYGSNNQMNIDLFIEVNISIFLVIFSLIISHFLLKKTLKITSFTYTTIVGWFFLKHFFVEAYGLC